MKRLILLLAVAFVLVGCGGGGKSNNPMTSTGQGASLTINAGDATNDRIIAFELTINSITLMGGSNPTVLSTPTEIEFAHDAGTFEPVSLTNVPSGTYTGATVTASNPQVVVIDPSTHQPTKLTTTLSASTINVTFNPSLMIGSSAMVLNFDLSLASSVTISGNTATVSPVFNVTTAAVAGENDQDFENGKMEDVRGTVTSVAPPKFMIKSSQASQSLTFTTDSNTRFRGITSLTQLMNGMIVSVDAATQSDGSLLARKVETEVETGDGVEVEGFITSVTGKPATQITLTDQETSSPSATAPAIGDTITIPISANTSFSVQSDHVDLSGVSAAFDANNIGPGQRVEVDRDHESELEKSDSGSSARIKLKQQALSGTVSALTGTPGTFTLTVASDSAFAMLSGKTTVTVRVQNSTQLKNAVANGGAVRVRGLLFFNGTSYTLVASGIDHP
jgi:hypothetical protein